MKLWTTNGSRRVLHAQVGRWKVSLRRGGWRLQVVKDAPGAYAGSLGPLFFTAMRRFA